MKIFFEEVSGKVLLQIRKTAVHLPKHVLFRSQVSVKSLFLSRGLPVQSNLCDLIFLIFLLSNKSIRLLAEGLIGIKIIFTLL